MQNNKKKLLYRLLQYLRWKIALAKKGGLFLGGLLLLLGNSEVSIQWQGIIWVLGCAFFTALYFQCQKFLSPKKDKVYHAKIMMRTMSFLFFLWWLQDGMPLNGLIGNGLIDNGLVGSGWIWLFLIGFICTYVAITANIIGVAILGASNSALLSGQEPVWTAFFSFLGFRNYSIPTINGLTSEGLLY